MAVQSAPSEFSLNDRYRHDRRSALLWIGSYVKKFWTLSVIMLIGAIGNAGLAAVVPILIGQALEAISNTPADINELKNIAIIIAASQIVRGVLQLGRNFSAELLGQRLERDIRDELFVSLLGKSMTFHSLQPVGDTMARATNDVREINFMFSPGINLVIGSAIFMIMPVLLSPNYHPHLILTPLLFTIFYCLALWQYLTELRPITDRVRESFGRINIRLAEAIDGIETVKVMAQELFERKLFHRNTSTFKDAFIQQGDVEARFVPLLLMALAQAGGLFHAILLHQKGLITLGDVVAYFGLLLLFGFPTFVSLFAYSQISLGLASARRILDLLNHETELDQNIAGSEDELVGEVEFVDVGFSYDEETPTLANINFKIDAGQTVAIVGQTGSGKTSLVKLLNRTYDVAEGAVKIDGKNIKEWKLEKLRQQISIIEQDIFLFSRSIADNIAFSSPGATEDEIIKAAKAAQAHEFIIEFEDSYQTVIGERGVTLSGGQRQRLALARAFLTNPKILILDDSTSSIDSFTEDKIQRAIFDAAEGRTTFIITHRLSQIRWADQIIVLKNGKIDQIGNHDDLLLSSEAYGQIFKGD